MARKEKLVDRLRGKPKDYTWSEACAVMKACGFELYNRGGSRRMFRHTRTRRKVILHEPHPRPTLLAYQMELLIEGLREVGEIRE